MKSIKISNKLVSILNLFSKKFAYFFVLNTCIKKSNIKPQIPPTDLHVCPFNNF